MPNGQTIINNVLTAIGVMRPGYTPNVADSTDALAEMNAMLDGWSAENALVYDVATAQWPLVAAQASYQIGTGAPDFSTMRPSRIEYANIVATVGSLATRTPVRIVQAKEYFAHGDLAAAANSPEELYVEYSAPYAKLFLFPAPSCPTATKLEIQAWVQLTQMDLTTVVFLPPGYQDAIQYGLAWRLLTHFEIQDQLIITKIEKLSSTAKDRIRALNVQNRLLDPALLPQEAVPAGR